MGLAFNSTNPNLNWAVNRLNNRYSVLDVLVEGIQGIVSGITGGNGSTASNADVEKAVQWAVNIANDDSHGYDNDPDKRQGPDYDCSSLVSNAFAQAGFGVDPTDHTYTMKADYTAHGFVWHDGVDSSQLLRGDILWKTGHTALYIGNDQIAEATCNEMGTLVGGRSGDQTGSEIRVYPFYGTWEGFLRYGG